MLEASAIRSSPGLALSDTRMILSGAIPAALLALLVDLVLGGLQRLVTPKALRVR